MIHFLIFLYDILKLKKKLNFFRLIRIELTRINLYNSRPDSLSGYDTYSFDTGSEPKVIEL